MNENSFIQEKARSRRYPTQTLTDADDADDITLLANIPAQDESQLHSLKKAAGGIGLHVNANKTEYLCFIQNERGDISTLKDGGSLKLEDKFTYLKSSVSSTENDINTRQAKARSTIDWLSIIWKSDLSGKIKHIFSKQRSYSYYNMDAHHMNAD